MCGRYAITLPPEAVRSYFRYVEQPNFPPRYNVAPTQPVPIVRLEGGERHFALVRWGFIPGFVKDLKTFPLIINAQAEGVAVKPSFRNAFRRRRCLFIADGFYEWRRSGTGKTMVRQAFLIRRPDRAPLGFAGLWECWQSPEGEIDTGCIITTSANAMVSAVHDRMPVILSPDAFAPWLDPETSGEQLAALLRPAPEAALELVALSDRVNRTANDDPACQTPL